MRRLVLTWIGLAMLAGAASAQNSNNPSNATITFQGSFPTGGDKPEPKLIYAVHSVANMQVKENEVLQTHELNLSVIQGRLKEAALSMAGSGEIVSIEGEGLQTWGIHRGEGTQRQLILYTQAAEQDKRSNWVFTVHSRVALDKLPGQFSALSFSPSDPALFTGFVRVTTDPAVLVTAEKVELLTPIDPEFFPGAATSGEVLAYRFAGGPYALTLSADFADPEARTIRLTDFSLKGRMEGESALFELTGTVVVNRKEGGVMELLSGAAALTELMKQGDAKLELTKGIYRLRFARPGQYPIHVKFAARVMEENGWKTVAFQPPPAALRPVDLQGLSETTKVEFAAGANVERAGKGYVGYLPPAGELKMRWQEERPEVEGKLFFSVNGLIQIGVSPGLLRETSMLQYKVMQGELRELALDVVGEGEVTRVLGEGILGWHVDPGADNAPRRLVVQLNQARKDEYTLIVQTQQPLGVFPLQVTPPRLVPAGAIRFGGHVRIINEGAVRLEVLTSTGLAQISPDRFPAAEAFGTLTEAQQPQAFAFRFSGADYALEIQADNVLPEVSVSGLLVYHMGETETAIQGELELEIREAPLREFALLVPGGYSLAQLQAPSLSDYNLGEPDAAGVSILTVQFGQPLMGHQLIQLRLTRSQDEPPTNWALVPVRPQQAKSVRGFVGVSADQGLRVIEAQSGGLSEIAPAFFPKKLPELQLAYRIRDPDWAASFSVERLALSVQVDSLHLFSIGEGIAYGSSLMNYLIAGAPVSILRVAGPTNYANVEFVGRDVRNWKQTETGYEVYLHSPVSGSYSLLATYDVQFNPRGEELTFNGLSPLEVQAEQGHVIVVSMHPFQTDATQVSPELIKLETGEVPAEYRLLFDAPILSAYQYTSRPFNVQLRLTSLGQGETVNQVVDRASFQTHVSGEGQVLTDARYFIKSQGHSHVRLTLPPEVTLWSAQVNGQRVVPVTDGAGTLIPLPQNLPPNQVLGLELKLASKSARASRVQVSLPRVEAPVLLADWQVEPDPAHQLGFRRGNVRPLSGPSDVSGFAWLMVLLNGGFGDSARVLWLTAALGLVGIVLWAWGTRPQVTRWSGRNLVGILLGGVAWSIALGGLITLIAAAANRPLPSPNALGFVVPVQAAGSGLEITLSNRALEGFSWAWVAGWPMVLGLISWIYAWIRSPGASRTFCIALGWTLVLWGILRVPQSAAVFFIVLALFLVLHVLIPLIRRQGTLPRRLKPAVDPEPEPPSEPGPAGATAALLIAVLGLSQGVLHAAPKEEKPPVVLQSVIQEGRVDGDHVRLQATLSWEAEAGQSIDFLRDPGVLTSIDKGSLRLVQERDGTRSVYRLIAQEKGSFTVRFDYQVAVQTADNLRGFRLPTHFGLINRLILQLDRPDMEVVSQQAVSIRPARPDPGPEASRFELVLAPAADAWIGWRPRTRDTRAEKVVFYAELFHLYIPTAGIIEGVHEVQVRLAQGQVRDLMLQTPAGMTITDVQADGLLTWRFDPDQRELRLQFEPAVSRPFSARFQSQITTGALPYQTVLGLVTVPDAAGHVGMVGVATGSDVQLVSTTPDGLAPINLEDFPLALAQAKSAEVTGLTVRRAFRASQEQATLTLSAAAVQPEVRLASRQTLSLGDDRSLLAVALDIDITRAGVFKLSFLLPTGMDVESISGDAFSHWTELNTDEGRVVTMHLRGKTEGRQMFSVNLVGPGVPAGPGWAVPRLRLREADKQTGQLVVVPEQGMRLHTAAREGISQLDPKAAGIRQKGVLAFRLLQPEWQLSFDVEKVDPWIQVTSLQDVSIGEGLVKVTVTLDYQVENAGVKSLFIELPGTAEAVRFVGADVSDSVRGSPDAGSTNVWEVKVDRRLIGNYQLQVHYQLPPARQTESVSGIRAQKVNLHRAYLTLRTSGRVQVNIPAMPPELVAADWRSIPATLRGGPGKAEGNFTFRALEPLFTLSLQVVRHEAARLLQARVEKTELFSTLSEAGEMITHVRMAVQPGDLRLLKLTLPVGGRFWFAFVNDASVWPWQENSQILIPLEQNVKTGEPATVEFFYSLPAGRGSDFALLGPQFDLPLENIRWRVSLPPTLKLKDWKSAFQLEEDAALIIQPRLDFSSYLQKETTQRQEQTREAEQLLQMGNEFLNRGYQQQARKAFQSAWTLSQHDYAFNEDARVQLHNLKTQQALVGLNARRQVVMEDRTAGGASTNAAGLTLQAGRALRFTQQEVQKALEGNTAEDNSALMRLAEQLVQQQDAAQTAPEAIRATLPEQGRQFTFTRSLQVDTGVPLRIDLETGPAQARNWPGRLMVLVGLLVILSLALRFKQAAA